MERDSRFADFAREYQYFLPLTVAILGSSIIVQLYSVSAIKVIFVIGFGETPLCFK